MEKIIMKVYDFDYSTFITGSYISKNICDSLISLYNNQKNMWVEGTVGFKNVDKTIKSSTELIIEPKNFDVLNDYLKELEKILESYKEKYPWSDKVNSYSIWDNVKIQYYKPGEGFHAWHCENNGRDKTRHLVFMTYLNDVKDGGTEFYHQNLITPAEKGLTLIWPAQWTHTHRGQISNIEDKYIITGWFNYNE